LQIKRPPAGYFQKSRFATTPRAATSPHAAPSPHHPPARFSSSSSVRRSARLRIQPSDASAVKRKNEQQTKPAGASPMQNFRDYAMRLALRFFKPLEYC